MAYWWNFARKNDKTFCKPQKVIEYIGKITHGNAIVTTDVGQHQMWAAQFYPFNVNGQWVTSGGLGTMGFGIPSAIGAQLASPDKTVVCFVGDGGFQMTNQEMALLPEYNLNVKIVLINNGTLGMVKQWQDMNYEGRHSSSYVDSLPDFPKLMEAYGHVGIQINHADELESKLAEAMAINDKCVFINVMVDRTEHVYPMQIAGQSMKDMWLGKGERTE